MSLTRGRICHLRTSQWKWTCSCLGEPKQKDPRTGKEDEAMYDGWTLPLPKSPIPSWPPCSELSVAEMQKRAELERWEKFGKDARDAEIENLRLWDHPTQGMTSVKKPYHRRCRVRDEGRG